MEFLKSLWKGWLEPILVAILLAFILRSFAFGLYHVPSGSAEPTLLIGDRLWGNKMAYYFSDVKRGDLVIFDNPDFPYASEGTFKYYWQRYVGFPVPLLGLSGGPDNVVKRVIAVPGDTIEGRVEDGKPVIYLNGNKLDEPYLNPFPLIKLRKTIGFFNTDIFPLLGFLQKATLRDNYYSYDSNFTYENQPFYKFCADELVLDPITQKPVFRYPATPTAKPNPFGIEDAAMFGSVDTFGPMQVPDNMYWCMGDSRKNSGDSRYWGFLDKKLIHGRASFIIWSLDSQEMIWFFDLIKHPIDFWTKHIRWTRSFNMLNKYNGWNHKETEPMSKKSLQTTNAN